MPVSDSQRDLERLLFRGIRDGFIAVGNDPVDDFIEHTGIPFALKKLVEVPIEFILSQLISLARGPLKAPAILIGEHIITGTAGHGEEDAIRDMIARDNAIRLLLLAIRGSIFANLGGTDVRLPNGVAMKLVRKDP